MKIPQHLRVVSSHNPPLVFVEESSGNGTTLFTGFLVDLLPMMLQFAGINSTWSMYDYREGSGGVQLSNGSWSGIMGELISGRADLSLFPLTLTAQRAQYIQHTAPYMDDGYGILVQAKQVNSGYSFLLPFEGATWIAFLSAMLFVMLLLALLDVCTRKARLNALDRVGGGHGRHPRKRDKLMNHAIETVMMAVNSGSAPTSKSVSVKILFVVWAIFCVIMLSAYTANLTANLTVNQLAVSIQSLDDLLQNSALFGVPGDSSVSQYFINSSDETARRLRPWMVEYKMQEEGIAAVRQGRISAYISDYPNLLYYTQVPPCNLALGTETVGSGQLVIGLSPNLTIAERLNMAMLQLNEEGHIAELRRKWLTDASQCQGGTSSEADSSRLSISQAWSVLLIVAAGAGVGVILAMLEVLYYKRFFKGIQELKHDLSTIGTREALQRRLSSRAFSRLSSRVLSRFNARASSLSRSKDILDQGSSRSYCQQHVHHGRDCVVLGPIQVAAEICPAGAAAAPAAESTTSATAPATATAPARH